MLTTRRSLLIGASLSAAPTAAWAQALPRGAFTHGVASGDPTQTNVILWTRFVPSTGGDARIAWEISEDENFRRTARRGRAVASPARDYCVKVDVGGLQPGRRYFYRFLSGADPSPTGRTMTAPRASAAQMTLALFSCSNLPFGYFHAYGDAAQDERIDLALHTGDYIYEYQRGVYPAADQVVPGRVFEPEGEIVRLGDYHQRYQSYHLDPDLQELRRLKPLMAVWDDHELTNDAWRDGAQNHQDNEGTWADRVAAAAGAYFDWMPIRRPDPSAPRLYRSTDWGDLARIVMLDTRLIGRDRQLDARTLAPVLAQGGPQAMQAIQNFQQQLNDPNRHLLGAAQEAWLRDQLAGSKQAGQSWQVLVQQLVIGEQFAPAGLGRFLPPDASQFVRAYVAGGAQLARLGVSWNMDSWGGYVAARQRLLEMCAAQGANVLAVAGDSHNAWANNLPAPAGGRLAALEFAGGSVTSPGLESALSQARPGERENALTGMNENLAWCDVSRRGYAAITLTRAGATTEWRAFDDVRTPTRAAPSVSTLTAETSAAAGPSAWRVS
ncbi:MAG: alkaline phosphatase D family protein [Hyphomonadaceae bacterium]|nr:alkaline phosphatase D family protein [Hyphomonadaceae bacterium]